MNDGALAQLDKLRRDAVERGRLSVFDAREQVQRAEAPLKRAQRQLLVQEHAVQVARQAFAQADDVRGLRAADAALEHTISACNALKAQIVALQSARDRLADALRREEDGLRDAELGRRAVERKLAQRAADVGRRVERQREAEDEDTYRSTRAR